MDMVGGRVVLDKQPFYDHFKELNKRIIQSLILILFFSVLAYLNYSNLYEVLVDPLKKAGFSTSDLLSFSLYEGFQVKITNTVFLGILISLPFIIFIIGNFFIPAFEKLSKSKFVLYLILFLLFFYLGIFSAYKTFPFAIEFFLSFNDSSFLLRTQSYFQLLFRICLLIGLTFQLPLFIAFLISREVIKTSLFTSNRREVFVLILILSAIITPTGDPLTLFIFAIPLYLLIELAIYIQIKRNKN
jgi:sec-independent protein translocase protein TatC